MRIHNIQNIDMLHIRVFAELAGRSITSTRYLVEKGNVVRQLKAFRDRSALYIPLTELKGYPFVKQGSALGTREIYHYVQTDKIGANGEPMWEAKMCPLCSYGQGCDLRKIADAVIVPEGDK